MMEGVEDSDVTSMLKTEKKKCTQKQLQVKSTQGNSDLNLPFESYLNEIDQVSVFKLGL